MEKQKTINSEVVITGVGLHTGETVTLKIIPADQNFGYKFQRTDLDGSPIINADLDNVIETNRGTTLEKNGTRIYTTEHVLAALYGLGIDNALIQMNGPEVPIMDGSSRNFVNGILAVGTREQSAEKEYYVITENLTYENLDKQVEMLAVPQEEFRLTVMVDYKSPVLGTQHASMYHLGEFKDEIASCRTFVFLREVEELLKSGLIKGGDVSNAIVMVDRDWKQEELDHLANLFNKPNITVEGIGILNNVKLNFTNEPARHKLLDIVGDLALIGVPIKGHVLAARPGHGTNIEFAKLIRNRIKQERKSAPHFDLNKEPLYDINAITKLLPRRYPFLLIDKILEMDENSVVGVKNVTMNEPFFQGHFPGNPVMPGVLLVEAMAQTGGVLVLSQVDDPECYQTYFMKIDAVKFKQKVLPGDTVVFKLILTAPIRRGICQMKAVAYVRNKVVAEGELMAQIVKVKEQENEPAVS